MSLIAVDIGGTHARFAAVADGVLHHPVRLAAADFPTLAGALTAFTARHDLPPTGTVLIAAAAQPGEDGIWRFLNHNGWAIDRRALQAVGWNVALLVNDFLASARGAVSLRENEGRLVKAGAGMPGTARAILGPGTGLGMAYMLPLAHGKWRVQETFGGHMLSLALTAEQMEVCAALRASGALPVPEDLASGRGLPGLYRAVCALEGSAPLYSDVAAILAGSQDPAVRRTLRLFHEFLGLFAHQVAVTVHAFDGLYLDGGLLHALEARGLFDFASFEKFFVLPAVPVVRAALESVPVRIINDPFIALRGLKEMHADA